jgi:tight adherence protein C
MVPSALVGITVFAGCCLLLLTVWSWWTREERLAQGRVRALREEASRPSSRSWGDSRIDKQPWDHGATPSRTGIPQPSSGDTDPTEHRGGLHAALVAVGKRFQPWDADARQRLQLRMVRAGFYNPRMLPLFQGGRLVLLATAALLGLCPGLLGVLTWKFALAAFAFSVGVGILLPGFWLDGRTRSRQKALRGALPDFLDMVVLCVEGGTSLRATIQRVSNDLEAIHPLLYREMVIVQREMLLGLSLGEAFQKMGKRTDVEEIRNFASILLQNDRYGSGVAKVLRIHADTLREQRQQRAEEMAQKAAVKILFPTLLCIFPAIFIVILGPAAFHIMEVFSRMK